MGKNKPKVLAFQQKSVAKSAGDASKVDINASSAERPAALNEHNLRIEVERIVTRGTIRETWHSRNDRSYRNIGMDDIQHMLRNDWKLKGKPQWSAEYGNWTYKVVGEDIDDDELTLVIALNLGELVVIVITKY